MADIGGFGGPCTDGGYHLLATSGFLPKPCIICGMAFLEALTANLDFYRAGRFMKETLVP